MRPYEPVLRAEGADRWRSDLDAIRTEIDRVDDAILAMIGQRLALSAEIARTKLAAGSAEVLLRPGREREVLSQLAAKAAALGLPAVDAVWRELMAISLQAQRPMEIVVHAAHNPVLTADLARRRFGCAAPFAAAADPETALDRARRTHAIAVIELSQLSSWWVALRDDPSLTIFEGLEDGDQAIAALAVGRIDRGHASPEMQFSILSEGTLERKIWSGDNVRSLACCGPLRLCAFGGEAENREAKSRSARARPLSIRGWEEA